MSRKVLAVILIIVLSVAFVLYVQTYATEILVLEIAYTVMPKLGDKNYLLEDVDLAFQVDTYFQTLQTYQIAEGFRISDGQNKIAIVDLLLNFSLKIDIVPSGGQVPWKSYNFIFSSLLERKIQVFVDRDANVTLGSKANVVIDAHLVAWYKGQEPTIDKSIHKILTVNIPQPQPD